ncbi:cyclomaltodextrin glucanotransferase, partial [Halobiforma nitratireducens JCM 10879]
MMNYFFADKMNLNRRTLLTSIGAGAIASVGVGAGTARPTATSSSVRSSRVNYTEDVIYQVMTDRFRDGDPSNNPDDDRYDPDCEELTKFCGGDWQGIIDRIEDGYLPDMGVTALWISPPFENIDEVHPENGTSYHAYWPRDFKRPNPYFGDMDDFERLIDVAHDHGIKVVIDFVPNHTSPADEDDPDYVEDGALYDDGEFVASYTDDPNGSFHRNGGIDDFDDYEESIYANLFDLADLNQQAPEIDEYLTESIKLWLDKGVDGIRIDAVRHMSPGWQRTLMSEIFDHRPVFTFGEWFLGEGERDQDYYDFANESGMSQLDFRYGQKLRQVLRDETDGWGGFVEVIEETAAEHDQVLDQVPFLDNHDKARWLEDESDDPRLADMGLAVLLTSRGVPKVYYGTEQYMTGDGDPGSREMMTSFDTGTNAYEIISTLSSLRQSNPALAYGSTRERWVSDDVIFYEREFGENVVLVGVNRSSEEWYEITNLRTALPGGSYPDILEERIDGFELAVNADGTVEDFWLGSETVSVWEHRSPTDEPTLGHVGPTMGEVGHTIQLSGEGFGSAEGAVEFGSTEASIHSWSDTRIDVSVPNVDGGYYDISVTDANSVESNAYEEFEVLTDTQVAVRFVVDEVETEPGENVYLTGNVNELGAWDPDDAVGPFFNEIIEEYPTWYYDVSVPADTDLEFKFIIVDDDGNVTWESGADRQ